MGTLDINWDTITPEQLLEITRSLSVSAGSGADIFYQGIDRHTTSIALADANFSMIDKSEAAEFLNKNRNAIIGLLENFAGKTTLSLDNPGNSFWADVSRRLAGEASGDVIVAIGNSPESLWSKSIALNDELPILIQRLKGGQINSINGLSKADLFSSNGVQLFSNTEVFTKLRSNSLQTLAEALEDAARSGQITNAQLFDTVDKITATGEGIYGLSGIEVRINHRTPSGETVVVKFTLAEISEFKNAVDQVKLSPGFKAGLISGAFEFVLTARAAHELLKSGDQPGAERLLSGQFAGVAGGAAMGALYGALTLGLMVVAGVPTGGLGATLILAASVTVGSTVGQMQANQLGTELYDFIKNYSGSDTLLPAAIGDFYVNWLKDEGVYAEVVLKNALSGVVDANGNASRQDVLNAVVRAVESDPSLLDDVNEFSGALEKAVPESIVRGNTRAFASFFRSVLEEVNGSCFPAGTMIEMADGAYRPIELVRPRDWVMSYDATTRVKVPREVVRLFRGETTDWVELAFERNGEQQRLTATPGHPFLRPDGTFAPIADLIDASGQAEIVLRDGTAVTAAVRLIRYSAETSGLYEQACSAALSGNTALALAPIDAWVTYNFEVAETHTYLAEGVCVHNRCAENFVTETTLNALIRAGLVDPREDTILRTDGGQYLIYSKEGRLVTQGALKGQPLVKVIEVFSDYALHIGDSIESVLAEAPQYLQDALPNLFSALVNGQDFEAAVEVYAANIAANMGIDVLARIFGLERLKDFPKDANGNPIIPPGADPKFFETEVGAAIKGALVSAAVMRILSGKDISPQVYQELAVNTSVRFVVTQALQTQQWATHGDVVERFADWFDFDATAVKLSPVAQAGAAAAASLLIDLLDGGIEDVEAALKNAAVAAGTTFLTNKILSTTIIDGLSKGISSALGATANIALPIIGAIISAAISKIFGKIFGRRPPPPPLFNIQQNSDGTLTVYFSDQASGYTYRLRDGSNDKLIGSSGNDALLGSSGDNELFGRDGNDVIEGREGDDLLGGGKGMDVLYAGTGDDTAIGNQGNDTIDGDEGNDLIFGGDGNDLLFGDSRFDQEGVSHGQRGDVSTLGEEGDPADGGSGGNAGNAVGNTTKDADATNNDVIMGGAGNDTVFAGKGKDYVAGSFGDDILLGQADDDVVVGGDHNDLINGGAGNDALDGEAGSDVIYGGVGDDVVNGDKLVILADTPVTAAIRKWLDTVVIGSQDLKGKLGIDKIYYPLSSSSDMPFAGSFTLGDILLLKVTAVESAVISGLEGKTGDISTAFMGWLASSDPALKTQIENRVFKNLSSDYKPAVDDSETDVDEAADNYDQLFLALGGGDDFIDTGEGNDAGYGGLGSDTLKGGEGNDSLYGDAPANGKDQDGKPLSEAPGDGDDLLYGGAGDDQIIGGGGTNTIEGGDGKDKILSGSGSDSIFGGAGADVIFGGGGDDLIHAGASGVPEGEKSASDFSVLDIVQAGAGSDTVYGEEGADLIGGGTEDDRLFGGAGDDNLAGDEGNDQVFGGEGADDLSGGDGEDALYGGQEGDDLYGGGGNDHLYGGDGNDVLEAGLGDDVIEGDVGNDTLLGQIGNDTLSGGDGIDVLSGGSDDDILTGDAGDDGLYGGSGNDEITGGLGNDFLEGGSGGDTLRGEAGSDSIFGDGQDGSAGGDDQIDAGSGDDIVLAGEGSDTVHAGSGNDSVHAGGDNDSVFGGDGNDTLNGEAGNDTLEGESGKDRLFGGAGADSLDGGSDNDVIDGGTGNDRISAGSGDDQITDAAGTDFVDLGDGNDSFTSAASDVEGDTVSGGAGNDVLDGGSGNDDLSGDEGDDFLAGGVGQDILNAGNGEDVLDGGADADTLISGRGKQTLQGGDGNDLYRIDLAGLRATISDSSGIDRIEISANYKPKDIVLEKDGNDLLLRSRSNPADHIRIYGQFAGDPKVETVLFASHSFSFNLTKVTIGTDGDDNILGTENDDIVLALAGKDIVIGAAGDDFLDGGPGKDALFGNMGNDLIHGSSEDDLLNGGADDDLINDGTGSDMLIGGEGRDTFAVTVKAGDHDTIADFETGLDTIDLKNFGGRFVTLKQMEYFRATFSINGSDTIITFDGNQKVTLEDIDFSTLSEGNFDFDLRSISGIIGTASHEIIKGGASADIILGNAGSDVLTGGSGGDTFVIGRDTGDIDQITDFAAAQDVVDLTAFSDYVSIYQFQVVQRGLDLTLSFGSDQHLILENVQKSQLTTDNFRFDVFKDKTNVSRYTGAILLDPAPNGIIEVETVFPSVPVTDAAASRAAQIIAGAGSSLSEGTYSESLAAGSNPEFTTSAGSSAISYNFVPVPYISNEHFNNPMSIEEIKDQFYLANGRYPSFLELMIIFSIPGIDQRTVISINQFGFPSNDAYYGGNWTESIATGLGDDRIFGRDGNDSLFGGFGNDEAYGGSGKDVLNGEDGNDYLNGELDNDGLFGGENNDHLYGEDGFDSLFGGAGDDRLDGGGHDDSLFGEEGYDRLDGGWGEDSLSGGDQDDHLHGDAGESRLGFEVI